MQETDRLDQYILEHIDEESEYLKALYRDTHVKLLRPRMASGHLQGRLLKMLVRMIRPQRILEIGTYSGYSASAWQKALNRTAACTPLKSMTNRRISPDHGLRTPHTPHK